MIERNPNRRPKKLWTASGEGTKIVGYVAESEHVEARYIVQEIDRLADEHGIKSSDVAIFYRTNAQSRALEELLMRAGNSCIPSVLQTRDNPNLRASFLPNPAENRAA